MGERIRAFIAIPLPRDVKDRAREIQARLREAGLRLRWVKPQAMHLTLKFLGDIDRDRVPAIEQALAAAAASAGPLALAARGIGVFPTVKKPRVLWMGVSGETASLLAVHSRLADELALLGFQPEKRRFNAHLTLARAKGHLDPRRLVHCMETIGGLSAVPFTARRMVLYRSELKPDGAVYTELAGQAFEHP
jgi:2'-5' RNA ligase